jgi:Icc-related predicted phosphoesterase
MRILFATDLHGSTLVLRKAIRCCQEFEVDCFLLGGDLSGKWLLPIVRVGDRLRIFEPEEKIVTMVPDDARSTSQQAYVFQPRLAADIGIQENLQRLEAKGYYWHFFDSDDDVYSLQPNYYDDLQRAEIRKRLEKWEELVRVELGEERTCFWTGGNDDEASLLDDFRKKNTPHFCYAEGMCIPMSDGLNLLSLGWSNRTPFDTAREMEESDLLAELQRIYREADDTNNLVLNVHVPPVDCGNLDLCKNEITGRMEHVGSTAVRRFIQDTNPIAVFSGHVHEGRGIAKVGRSVVFNPGSAFNAGVLMAFVVSLNRSGVLDHVHVIR